jgi:hypothetical protein
VRGRAGPTAVVVLLALAVGWGGCGGGKETDKHEGRGGEEGENGQAKALAKVPVADQVAFTQLAKTIGLVRVRAAPVAVGRSPRLASPAAMLAGKARIAALRPRDRALAALRDRLGIAITRFSRAPTAGPTGRRGARAALADPDRIQAGLRIYAARQPGVGALVPD